MRKRIDKSNLWNTLFCCKELAIVRGMTMPGTVYPEDVPLKKCNDIYLTAPIFSIFSPSIAFFIQFNYLNTMRFDTSMNTAIPW